MTAVDGDGTTATVEGIAAGPYVRLVGEGVSLEIAGQSLSADIYFEQMTLPTGEAVFVLGINNLVLGLGDGTTDYLTVTEGQGLLIVTSQGVVGELSARVALAPSLDFTLAVDRLSLAINTQTSR